jgi:tetratricopeptide (TPR) repeat protein
MTVANQALVAYPNNSDILYARSLLAEKMDNLLMTEADLRTILIAEPENVHALNALGYTLADRTDRLMEAYGYIQKAYKLAPDEPAVLDSMGWVLYRMGRPEEAIRYLRGALAIMPDDEIAAHLGEVLWVTGMKAEAKKVWNKALEAKPDSTHIRDVLKRFKQ